MGEAGAAKEKQPALVTLAHGSGGRLATEFIQNNIVSLFGGSVDLDDAAVVKTKGTNLAFTTDSFVVKPIFFPGGDIGRLAVFGTVNDLAVQGAEPSWLSLSIVVAEGLPLATLTAALESAAAAAVEAGVKIVTGDTKVVEAGSLDGLIFNTAGIGELIPGAETGAAGVDQGDVILVSGEIGAHEMAVLSHRYGLGFGEIGSDCASISEIAAALIKKFGSGIKWMRDPTRGGLATVLNELAVSRQAQITIDENLVPVNGMVRDAADILGLDPLYLACEGRIVVVVDSLQAEAVVKCLHGVAGGENGRIIGAVRDVDCDMPQVSIDTRFGSRRILRYLASDQQPRIC